MVQVYKTVNVEEGSRFQISHSMAFIGITDGAVQVTEVVEYEHLSTEECNVADMYIEQDSEHHINDYWVKYKYLNPVDTDNYLLLPVSVFVDHTSVL